MKKIIAILLAAMLLVGVMAPTAFAAEHTGSVTVVYTASGDDFAGFQGNFTYNHDVFTLESVAALNGGDIQENIGADFALWAVAEDISAGISVLQATFSIKPGAKCDTYSFGFALSDTSNKALESVSLSVVGNSVTLNHDWVAGTTVDATCTEDGYTPYTCSICGKTKQDTIDALGHVAGAVVIENKTGDTCTDAGSYDEVVYCTVCGEELSRNTVTGSALGHQPADAVNENVVPATCGKPGSHDEVVYCSVCGVELSRETVTDPATGNHSYTWKDNGDGKTHTGTCSCNHSFSEDHTYGPDGRTCTKCGYKKPADNTTPTNPGAGGDMGDITPYPVFFLMAVAAVLGTAYGFKRFAK